MERILNIQSLCLIVIVLAISNFVKASTGDRLQMFRMCLTSNEQRCQETGYPAVLPWHLTLFGWSCIDELKYQCMHNTTSWVLGFSKDIYQYYGKVLSSFPSH